MKTVVFYENNPEKTMDDFMAAYPGHQENEKKFSDAGKIIGIGPFAVPGEGAMGIFTDRESAEEFIKGDPFVHQGLVSKVTVKEWTDEYLSR